MLWCHSYIPQDPAGGGDSPVCPVLQSPGCRDQLLGAAVSHHIAPGPELVPLGEPRWSCLMCHSIPSLGPAPAELICRAGSLHSCWQYPSVIPANSSSWSQKLDIGSSLITSLPHEFNCCTSGTLPRAKVLQVQELPQQQTFEIQ